VFNHLKYDAMTFGNHEPDFGTAALRDRIKEAKFPFVAANLANRSDRESFVAPYVIKKLAGISVGIVGLTYPKTPWTTSPKNVEELNFLDPVAAIELQLPKLRRDGADLIVVVSHLGLGEGKWELDRLYRVATNSMLAKGGHNQRTFLQGQDLQEHGSQLKRLNYGSLATRRSEHQSVVASHFKKPFRMNHFCSHLKGIRL